MRCLLIDNYDSFTWNLADYIGRAFGEAPAVIRNDDYPDWDALRAALDFDSIVVSPGPGSVTNLADVGLSRAALAQDEIPLLGVCLGFQGIVHAHGGRILHAPEPFHGRPSEIYHDGDALLAGIPSPFSAIRYHSLIADPALPDCLRATAHTRSGLVMALRHRELPKWGVQFHPESILTECGMQILRNFRDLAQARRPRKRPAPAPPRAAAAMPAPQPLQVLWREVSVAADAEAIFAALYATQRNGWWLDSQVAAEGSAGHSFFGTAEDSEVLRYRLDTDSEDFAAGQALLAGMDAELQRHVPQGGEDLPFAFRGGFVGLLGYEMKALFGGGYRGSTQSPATPDALWLRVRRFVACEPATRRCWIVALAPTGEDDAAEAWLAQTAAALADVPALPPRRPLGLRRLQAGLDLDREAYLSAIAACRQAIVDGESYEICLTNRFSLHAGVEPFALYRELRAGNAAPFGAFLQCGEDCVLSTSPERFLRVDAQGNVQAKPIKGTRRRAEDREQDRRQAAELESSVKERAENLMIVDLMRNDLNRVSLPGSVRVPRLRAVESYRTVHQLVSTVESTLRPECSLMDLLRAAFPGGSISGAPKLRTLQIIDRLEPSPRGAYTGSVGYLGYGRVADLNIAIRTLACGGGAISFGAGGAITWLSEPEAEWQEMLLKAEAVLRPLWRHLAGADAGFDCRMDKSTFQLEARSALGQTG